MLAQPNGLSAFRDGRLHEIKHDGFRLLARKDGDRVRLYSRHGNDLTYRFPLIVEALAKLGSRTCMIDGDAVACDETGMSNFNRIRYRRHDATVFLYAFDLLELNGDDQRREPIEVRKATLASVLASAALGLRLNEHMTVRKRRVLRGAERTARDLAQSEHDARSPIRASRTVAVE